MFWLYILEKVSVADFTPWRVQLRTSNVWGRTTPRQSFDEGDGPTSRSNDIDWSEDGVGSIENGRAVDKGGQYAKQLIG